VEPLKEVSQEVLVRQFLSRLPEDALADDELELREAVHTLEEDNSLLQAMVWRGLRRTPPSTNCWTLDDCRYSSGLGLFVLTESCIYFR
jgi:hypothetical protein